MQKQCKVHCLALIVLLEQDGGKENSLDRSPGAPMGNFESPIGFSMHVFGLLEGAKVTRENSHIQGVHILPTERLLVQFRFKPETYLL